MKKQLKKVSNDVRPNEEPNSPRYKDGIGDPLQGVYTALDCLAELKSNIKKHGYDIIDVILINADFVPYSIFSISKGHIHNAYSEKWIKNQLNALESNIKLNGLSHIEDLIIGYYIGNYCFEYRYEKRNGPEFLRTCEKEY